MPGTEYVYRITLDASAAKTSARDFAKHLRKELGKLKVKGQIDVKNWKAAFKTVEDAAAKSGQTAGDRYAKAMKASSKRILSMSSQWGVPQAKAMEQLMSRAMAVPSKAMKQELKGLEGSMVAFQQRVSRLGIQPDDWLGVSGGMRGQVAQYGMALQAAQRRVWGIRGMGAQAQMYGREAMMAGGAALGGAGAAGQQYAQFAEPLGRAARNLELNATLTAELDQNLRQLAGTASVFTPEEQAEGLYLWAAATGEVVESSSELDQLLGRVGTVQKLASLGMVDYGTAVEAVTDVQSQFQMNVSDTEQIVATMVKVAATSKAEVGDLAEAFRYAGTYAAQTNTSFEELAAIFQILSAYGQRGTMAGRGMARVMEGLIAPSQEAKEAMDELFQSAFGRTDVLQTSEGQFVGMAEAINILADATENLTEMERAEFVAKITTQNAARVLLPLLSAEIEARHRGISAIEENIKIIGDQADASTQVYVKMMDDLLGFEVSTKSATDTMDDQWAQFLESTDGKAKALKASFNSAMVSIGKIVVDVALPALVKLSEVVTSIARYAELHPGGVAAVLAGATATVAIGALVSALGKGITLYADLKAIAMAVTYKKSVDQFGIEVGVFAASVNRMIGASGGQMVSNLAGGLGVAQFQTGSGLLSKAGAAGKGALAAGAAAAGPVAGMLVAVLASTELVARLTTGRSMLDLMNTDAEALAAAMVAAADASERIAAAGPKEEDRIRAATDAVTEARERRDKIKSWMRAETILGGTTKSPATGRKFEGDFSLEEYRASREIVKQIPEEFRSKQGLVDAFLLEEGYQEAQAAVEEYEAALVSLQHARRENALAQSDELMIASAERYVARREAAEAREEAARLASAAAAAAQDLPSTWSVTPMESRAAPRRMRGASGAGAYVPEGMEAISGIEAERLLELGDALGIDIEKLGLFSTSVSGAHSALALFTGDAVQDSIIMLRELGNALPSDADMSRMIGSSASTAWSSAQTLLGTGATPSEIASMQDQFMAGLEMASERARGMGTWEAELYLKAYTDAFTGMVQENVDAHDQMTKNAEQAVKDQQRLYEQAEQGLRGFVERALSPTKVTSEDFAATRAGDYKDKWDEEVRRMRAAMAGSADWKEMIPANVWAQGTDAAHAWGEKWITQFYSGMNPDAIRWDALLDSIVQSLAMEAGKKNLVEVVMQKLADERGITATSEQVMQALGLSGIIPGMAGPAVAAGMAGSPEAYADQALAMAENIVGPLGEKLSEVDMTDSTSALLTNLTKGIGAEAAKFKWVDQLKASLDAQLGKGENQTALVGSGMKIGNLLWNGIYKAFEDADIVYIIAHKVVEIIQSAREDAVPKTGGAV